MIKILYLSPVVFTGDEFVLKMVTLDKLKKVNRVRFEVKKFRTSFEAAKMRELFERINNEQKEIEQSTKQLALPMEG